MRTLFRRRSALDLGPVSKAISYVLLVAWAFVVLFPLYWLAITSLKQPIDVDSGPVYLPGVDFKPTLDAWKYILVDLQSDTVRPYVNTVVVGLSSALIALILGSSAAYALVRFRYSPRVGLLGTRQALIITYVATNLPIVVWLMRDYFSNVPIELEESAAVDGASPYRIFRSIVLPVAVPGLVATFLFVLVFAWNEYLLALFLSSANAQTMPLTVAAQNATRGPQWWYMSVLILIMILPVIAMAVALERYISRGILVGAVKG